MSSELLTGYGDSPAERNGHLTNGQLNGSAANRRAAPRRPHGPVNRWWVRIHRWLSLGLGLLLLLECTTGVVLLYGNDLAELAHPERYVATPSATPMSQAEALALVRREHPELRAQGVQEYDGIYLVRGPARSRESVDAFVDPGSGRINGVGTELPGFVLFLINVHDCGLTCEGLPGYQAWLTTPLPAFFGENMTVGYYLLGALGALLVVLCLSGSVIWWPGLRALATGFSVRGARGPYVRDLDLHRLVGIVAVPFLLMWGVTGAAFYFSWPAEAYFALTPGTARADPAPPPTGTGPTLSLEQARDVALAAPPGAEVAGFTASDVESPGGTYRFRLRDGFDPYRYWNWSGNLSVTVDSHGGGIQDWSPELPERPAIQRWWDDGLYYGLHFGTLVPGWPRLLWAVFGLTPVLLGVTGLTVWLTKFRSARNRRRRARADPAR